MEGESDIRAEIAKLRESLEQTQKIVGDNNRILIQMRFWGRIAFAAKIVIWAIVLISPFVIISYLSPFLKALPGNSSSASSTSLFGYPTPTEVLNNVK
jgi:predicted MFS family arabinose efflux permease